MTRTPADRSSPKHKSTGKFERKRPALVASGFSRSTTFDWDFVASNVASALDGLTEFHGCTAEVIGFSTVRSNGMDYNVHLMRLRAKNEKLACIGISFCTHKNGPIASTRRPVDTTLWELKPWRPSYHAGIAFASWDEAWAFICLLGEKLEIGAVTLRFGI
jgi:hypothetical protein